MADGKESGIKYTRPLSSEEDDSASIRSFGETRFSPKKRTKTEKILAASVVLLAIFAVIMLALFIHARSKLNACNRKPSGARGQ